MYSPHNEHDEVWDKWNNEWAYVSHAELGKHKNRFRFVYHGDTFTSPKTGKTWQFYKKGDNLGVRPFTPTPLTPTLPAVSAA
jgi:hypothetical protein